MKKNVYIENWRLAWLPNAQVNGEHVDLKTPADVEKYESCMKKVGFYDEFEGF